MARNANQACPETACEVVVSKQAENVRLMVRDLGPGIPPAVMQKVFLPFFSTREQGSGIGLSLCKEVVDAHGGTIELSNCAGKGLEVMVVLPICETKK